MAQFIRSIDIKDKLTSGYNSILVKSLATGLTTSDEAQTKYSTGNFIFEWISEGDYTLGYRCVGIDGDIFAENLIIPGEYEGFEVREIGSEAFKELRNVTSVVLPNTIKKIGFGAFSATSIVNVEIPSSVNEIGDAAFSNCLKLAEVIIEDSVKNLKIGEYAFTNCSALSQITLPDGVTSIGNALFSGCGKLTRVVLGNGITKIPDYMFSGCISLTDVEMGNSIKSIGTYAFGGCRSLTNIRIPASTDWMWRRAFDGCGLKSVELDNPYGWFYTEADEVPADIKESENCWRAPSINGASLTGSAFLKLNWFRLSKIPAPTISVDNGILTITDASGLAETFNISISDGSNTKEIVVHADTVIKTSYWNANETIDLPNEDIVIDITFLSADRRFNRIEVLADGLHYRGDEDIDILVYSLENGWLDENVDADELKRLYVLASTDDLPENAYVWFINNFTRE